VQRIGDNENSFDNLNNVRRGRTRQSLSRRVSLALLVSAAAPLLCATTAQAANKAAAQEIIAFEQALAAATTPETIADGFTEDARQYDPAAKSPSIGKAAILAHLQDQMAQVKSLTGQILDIWADADADGNLGYDVSEQKGVLTMKDGKTTNFHLWAAHVLRKEGGKWKVLVEQVTYLP
jgi:ketosteroid isomerase-like protein